MQPYLRVSKTGPNNENLNICPHNYRKFPKQIRNFRKEYLPEKWKFSQNLNFEFRFAIFRKLRAQKMQ